MKLPDPHKIKHVYYQHFLGCLTIVGFVVAYVGAGPVFEGGALAVVGLLAIYDPTVHH